MAVEGVKKSVCLSRSKYKGKDNEKSKGRDRKARGKGKSASLRTLAFRSHFFSFFLTALNFSFGSFSFVSRQKKMNIG